MKKILFALSFAMVGSTVAAVAQKNTLLQYGVVSVGTSKDANDNKTKSGSFDLGLGYQFDHNWTVGLAGGYGTDRARAANQNEWDLEDQYHIGPFVRYTLPLNRIFAIYNQLEAGYYGSSIGNTGVNTRNNTNGFYATLSPAVQVTVGYGWNLNFGIGGINFTSFKPAGSTNSNANNNFEATFGSQFSVGISRNISCGRGHHMGKFKKRGNRERLENENMDNDGYNRWKKSKRDREDD